ncbi:hypothetical protein QYF36_007166 [Acer negundo]|nr:hypothetical protein QYF36_007166 [Acer negundo]
MEIEKALLQIEAREKELEKREKLLQVREIQIEATGLDICGRAPRLYVLWVGLQVVVVPLETSWLERWSGTNMMSSSYMITVIIVDDPIRPDHRLEKGTTEDMFGVMIIGEIDIGPLHAAMRRKFSGDGEEAEVKAIMRALVFIHELSQEF